MPFGRRLLLALFLFLLSLLLLNSRFSPILRALATTAATRQAEQLISAAVYQQMANSPALYSDIVTLTYKENGDVAALTTNTQRLIAMRTELALAVLGAMQDRENMEADVPLSALLGLNFLPTEPSIPLRLRQTKSLNAYFLSRFDEYGINQTRHRIIFCLTIDVTVLIPGGIETVTATREFPFAETLIVGAVPDAYTKINRLTGDITEAEIDDIYDFGASAS